MSVQMRKNDISLRRCAEPDGLSTTKHLMYLWTYSCHWLVALRRYISHSSLSQWNTDTRHEAQSFLLALSQFSFIVSLLLTQEILAYTKGISVKLQGRYVDIVKAHQDIESILNLHLRESELQLMTHDIVYYYDEALCLSQLVGVQESSPRLASRQQQRSNIPSGTGKE